MKSSKLLLILFCLICSGCTGVFLQPSKTVFATAFEKNIAPRPFRIQSYDGTLLSAWYFSSTTQPAKGLVVQFHGNAENMTTHFQSLYWLAKEGYDLITFDYRGYGTSEGDASLGAVYNDAVSTLDFTNRLALEKNLPLIVIGQSLGGSLLLKALEEKQPSQLCAIVVESSFYSYRQLAQEKLDLAWLTKPFKFLTPILVSEMYSPGGDELKNLPHVPKFLLYSEDDPIVPISHGRQLFNEMLEPKYFWSHPESGHINSFFIENGKFRSDLVRALNGLTKKVI